MLPFQQENIGPERAPATLSIHSRTLLAPQTSRRMILQVFICCDYFAQAKFEHPLTIPAILLFSYNAFLKTILLN